jgi:sirohydrochlorin ferrochelatase
VATAFILFAHGSSVESANEAVRIVAREVARQSDLPIIETAFLEAAKPDLPAAVHGLVEQGFRRIVTIPYFLTLGIHLRRDLPAIVEGLTRMYDGLTLSVTEPLDGHPALTQIVLERAKKATEC